MTFLENLRIRARDRRRRIVLPEGGDPRTIEAANRLASEGLAEPIVLASAAEAEGDPLPAPEGLADGVTWVDPRSDPRLTSLAEILWQRRKAKGMSEEQAGVAARAPLLFGALLVAAGGADGSVAGAVSSTGDVLRAAFWAIGPAKGISTVSSSFYMVLPVREEGEVERVLTFTDPAVVPDPTPIQLAEIAVAAADARRKVVGDEPRLAFLSYSTHGSASGAMVERVREALALFRERAPETAADGELQADAALVPEIGRRKAPGARVQGDANVLVFPDLNAGNIGYKLVERLAGASAIGPIIQGLAHPCNDLSRGAAAEDIVNVACITSLMAS